MTSLSMNLSKSASSGGDTLFDEPLPTPVESPNAFIPLTQVASMNLEIVPPTHAARTLVLCFDGTGDQFDSDVG